MTIDPTALALLSIFGGVAITVAAGLIGAAIQARREHSRWIREQRFSAYRDFLNATERWHIRASAQATITIDLPLMDEVLGLEATLALLGPDTLLVHAMAIHRSITHSQDPNSEDTYYHQRKLFVEAARRQLKVRKAGLKSLSQVEKIFPDLKAKD